MYIQIAKVIIIVSILYVWLVRYNNIVEEFKAFNLPEWLRDFVGIIKISSSIFLLSSDTRIVQVGILGIVFLMLAAQYIHFINQTTFFKRMPSLVLILFSAFIFFNI